MDTASIAYGLVLIAGGVMGAAKAGSVVRAWW